MSAWSVFVNFMCYPTIILLTTVSMILLVAIIMHRQATLSAAMQHAILLSALYATGLCPLIVGLAHHWNAMIITLPQVSTSVTPTDNLQYPRGATITGVAPASYFKISQAMLLVWLLGATYGFARILRGVHEMRRIQRDSVQMAHDKLQLLRAHLAEIFGSKTPEVLISGHIDVPVAIGFIHPVVILPAHCLSQFDSQQLLQILVHESAHCVRHDAAVGLYQRCLASLLWFNPLIHVTNRLLCRTREDICDNYVLQIGDPHKYSDTLLSVAQSASSVSQGWIAPTLVRSLSNLESRICSLLDPNRRLQTKLGFKKFAVVSACFLSFTTLLSCLVAQPSAQPDSQHELSHEVEFVTGRSYWVEGDAIKIDDIRGTSERLEPGNLYQVKGTYKLTSRNNALIAAYVTVNSKNSELKVPGMQTQHAIVNKGDGHFTLLFYMWQNGDPHISFYPSEGGNSFDGVYFQDKDSNPVQK